MKTNKVNFQNKAQTVQFFESPHRQRLEEAKTPDPNPIQPVPTNQYHNFRNDLLQQCDNQFDVQFSKLKDFDAEPRQKTISPSPYQNKSRTASKSPMKGSTPHDVEGFIQGAIDNQMSEQQIMNKQAFVWAFGKNQEGELSLGMNKDTFLPRFISGLQGGTSARFIASSNHHTAIVNQDGLLMVCGSSLHGKLGIDNLMKTYINKLQVVPALAKRKVKQVACSDYHTLCLLEDCSVYQFGGTLNKEKKEKKKVSGGAVQPIQSLYGKDIVQIDCGDFHSVALDANGDLYTWGGGQSSYNKGQCGQGHNKFLENAEKVQSLASKRITKVACGGFHTLCLTSDNEVYSFGSGVYGECGYGEFLDTSKPKLVKFPLESQQVLDQLEDFDNDEGSGALDMYLREQPQITNIAAGGRHSLALTNKGRLYTFGYGQNGQLGLRNNSNYAKPQLVKDLLSKKVFQIAAGWNHSLILTEKGDLFTCGYGQNGQLGLGDKESRTAFTHVSAFGNKRISQLFAGGNHSWVILDEIVPIRENYEIPSPIKEEINDRSRSNTPMRRQQINHITKTLESGGGKNQRSGRRQSFSPFQEQRSGLSHVNNLNDNTLRNPLAQKSPNQVNIVDQRKNMRNTKGAQEIKSINEQDDFVQKVLDIQQQQLQKASYFIQVTYCDTEFCHRFINFEVHSQFIRNFEGILEEYVQQCYSNEKGIMYHRIQEVPIQMSQPNKQTPGERLLKENQRQNDTELSEINEEEEGENDGSKSYTLCLICNPVACGYDQLFGIWKQSQEQEGKIKKIVINQGNGLKAVPSDENQTPLIGKIVFMKDIDIEQSEFEEQMSNWMLNFHRKLSKYCVRKPRFSELRPMKYSLT